MACTWSAPTSWASEGQLALGCSLADDQASPALLQRCVQLLQALEQELGARPGGVTPVEQALVEAERADQPVVGVQRGAQRGLVVHPQVA